MLGMVNQILDFTRLRALTVPLDTRPVDALGAVTRAMDELRPVAEAKRVRVDLAAEGHDSTGAARRGQPGARGRQPARQRGHFTAAGGSVTLRLAELGDRLELPGARHRGRHPAGRAGVDLRALPSGPRLAARAPASASRWSRASSRPTTGRWASVGARPGQLLHGEIPKARARGVTRGLPLAPHPAARSSPAAPPGRPRGRRPAGPRRIRRRAARLVGHADDLARARREPGGPRRLRRACAEHRRDPARTPARSTGSGACRRLRPAPFAATAPPTPRSRGS